MKLAHALVAASAIALLAACGSAPTIESFTADKSAVPYGGTVKLTWSVKDADAISINGVTVNGTAATDNPTTTTQYVLTATNSHGSVTSPAVTVGVTAGLSVSGGTYNSGSLGTTYLVRLRDASGQPQSADTVVTISPPGGGAVSFTCGASEPVCLYVDAGAPQGGTYVADATLGGDALTTSFTVDGSSTLPAAQVSANVDTGTNDAIDAAWNPVNGAELYVAQAFDLDTGDPISDAVDTTDTSAQLTLTASLVPDVNYGVAVSAFAVNPLDPNLPLQVPTPNGSRGLGYLQNVPGNHWSVYGPADYGSDGSLSITVANLDATEHLAVLVYNLGSTDLDPRGGTTNVNLSVSGVSASVAPMGLVGSGPTASSPSATPLASSRVALRKVADEPSGDPAVMLARRAKALRGHELMRAREKQILADASRLHRAGKTSALLALVGARTSTAAATNTSFCVQQGIDPGASDVRKNATLVKETAHALFYVDDDDLGEYTPYETGGSDDVWTTLGNLWETTIYPTDTGTFGAASDVDANGKLIIFISHELGGLNANGAITLGYYYARDVVYAKDTSSGCTGSASNGADMFYLNDLDNLYGANYPNDEVLANEYPDTLAHEFQHLINFNQKHIVYGTFDTPAEDTWINEGLSVTAEDLVGFGWNTAGGRSEANALLTDLPLSDTNPYQRYFNTSLFNWTGDPVGDYQSAHTFFRYFADRLGDSVLGSIVQDGSVGTDNVGAVLGEPFDRAYGEWITALTFSNELFSPASRFDFTGANWTPLHTSLQASSGCSPAFPYPNRLGYLQYETFSGGFAQAALRSGGWNAFITNGGTGAPVTLTVTPTVSGVTPYVVVVRYAGFLDDGRQSQCAW